MKSPLVAPVLVFCVLRFRLFVFFFLFAHRPNSVGLPRCWAVADPEEVCPAPPKRSPSTYSDSPYSDPVGVRRCSFLPSPPFPHSNAPSASSPLPLFRRLSFQSFQVVLRPLPFRSHFSLMTCSSCDRRDRLPLLKGALHFATNVVHFSTTPVGCRRLWMLLFFSVLFCCCCVSAFFCCSCTPSVWDPNAGVPSVQNWNSWRVSEFLVFRVLNTSLFLVSRGFFFSLL